MVKNYSPSDQTFFVLSLSAFSQAYAAVLFFSDLHGSVSFFSILVPVLFSVSRSQAWRKGASSGGFVSVDRRSGLSWGNGGYEAPREFYAYGRDGSGSRQVS